MCISDFDLVPVDCVVFSDVDKMRSRNNKHEKVMHNGNSIDRCLFQPGEHIPAVPTTSESTNLPKISSL